MAELRCIFTFDYRVFLARNDGGEEFAIKAYINDQVSLSKRLSIAKN